MLIVMQIIRICQEGLFGIRAIPVIILMEKVDDIGLIRLARDNTTISPAVRYTGSNEIGQGARWVGFGMTGDGNTGENVVDNKRRGCINVIDERGNVWDPTYSSNVVAADFDSPHWDLINRMGSSTPTDFEGCIAHGDSGGGVFAVIQGTEYLVAINVGVDPYGSQYNDVSIATSVAPFNAWINSIIQNQTETLTWNSASNGYFALYNNWTATRLSFATPIYCDTVELVDTGGTPTITFTDNVTTSRLRVLSGSTTFDLGGYSYSLTSTAGDGAVQINNSTGGNAQLTIRNGNLSTPSLKIATSAGGGGSLTIDTGGKVICSSGTITVGDRGMGIITQNSGEVNAIGTTFYLGSEINSRGGYVLSGGNVDCDTLVVGRNGRGIFTQDAGTVTDSSVIVGQSSADDNYYQQNSGTHTISQELDIAVTSTSRGTYFLNGGILALQGIQKGSGVAAFNFGGGTLQAIASFTTNIPMTLTGVNGNAKINTNSFDMTLSGQLSGIGGLEKQGAGILTLSADNNYIGATNIISGTLALDATGQISQSAAINNNATFEIIAGTHTVHDINGSGTTIVDAGTLTADSIFQSSLTIGAGALVVISPIAGGPLAGSYDPAPCLNPRLLRFLPLS